MAKNEIYQYSTASALMDGVASHGLPISQLNEHGDFGLGTFRQLVGEMIILDGRVYQMKSDGTVTTVSTSTVSQAKDTETSIAPFAMTTFFQPTLTVSDIHISDKADLSALLTALLPHAHNLYLAFRIHGRFRSLQVRTVGGQSSPHESLTEVGKRQASRTFDDGTEGVVVGFRSPEYASEIGIKGDHLHFITQDRKRGGHVLGLASEGGLTVEVAQISRVMLELPVDDEDFEKADLKGSAEALAKVEG